MLVCTLTIISQLNKIKNEIDVLGTIWILFWRQGRDCGYDSDRAARKRMPLLFSVSTERRQLSLPRFFRYMTIRLFSDKISFCLIGAVLEYHVRCT